MKNETNFDPGPNGLVVAISALMIVVSVVTVFFLGPDASSPECESREMTTVRLNLSNSDAIAYEATEPDKQKKGDGTISLYEAKKDIEESPGNDEDDLVPESTKGQTPREQDPQLPELKSRDVSWQTTEAQSDDLLRETQLLRIELKIQEAKRQIFGDREDGCESSQ